MKFTRELQTENIVQGDEYIFSICSDLPYERTSKEFGTYDEVLTISSNAIDFSRLNSGNCAFLKDHDPEKVLGVITTAWIEGNKVKCKVKFSEREDVVGYVKDIEQGIMTSTSIGYSIDQYHFEKINDKKTMIADHYMIYEASLVGIPADPSVGYMRNMNMENEDENKDTKGTEETTAIEAEKPLEDENTVEDTESKPTAETEAEDVKPCSEKPEETKECSECDEEPNKEEDEQCGEKECECETDEEEIRSLGELLDQQTLAAKFISEKRSLSEFKETIKNYKNNLNIKEKKNMEKFSLRKALLNATGKMTNEDASFERSIIEENKRKFNISDADIVLSKNELRAFNGSDDAALQGTEYKPGMFGEALRAPCVLEEIGVKNVFVPGRDITFAVATSGIPAAYSALNSDLAAGSMAFTEKTLRPKKYGTYVEVSYQSLLQDDPNVESIITNDITKALATCRDKGAFKGVGGDNEPSGLLIDPNVNTVSYTGTPVLSTALAFEKKIREANDYSKNLAWVMGTDAFYAWKAAPKSATALNDFLINDDNECIGYPVAVSDAMPASGIILGNFAEEFIEASFDGVSLKIVEDATLARKGSVGIIAQASNDFCARRPKSFTKRA